MTRRYAMAPQRPLRVQCADCRSWFWVDDLHTWRGRRGLCAECAAITAEADAARQVERAGVAVRYRDE